MSRRSRNRRGPSAARKPFKLDLPSEKTEESPPPSEEASELIRQFWAGKERARILLGLPER